MAALTKDDLTRLNHEIGMRVGGAVPIEVRALSPLSASCRYWGGKIVVDSRLLGALDAEELRFCFVRAYLAKDVLAASVRVIAMLVLVPILAMLLASIVSWLFGAGVFSLVIGFVAYGVTALGLIAPVRRFASNYVIGKNEEAVRLTGNREAAIRAIEKSWATRAKDLNRFQVRKHEPQIRRQLQALQGS